MLQLKEFTADEAAQLVAFKRAHVGHASAETSRAVVDQIIARAQGNLFYIDELLNYVHDLGRYPHDPAALEGLGLPTTLHSLILSRIDQLSERQQLTVKVASIVGRVFRESWLRGVYAPLGSSAQIKTNLEALSE